MKTHILTLIILLSAVYSGFAQQTVVNQIPISTGYAPAFVGKSTQGNISFPEDYYGKWKIIFSHPADFTPVCTSEIIALAEIQDEFKKLNTALIVISTDGLNSHIEWIKSMESISLSGKAPVKIDFPLVSDLDLSISNKYGILQQDGGKTMDRRMVYIINEENKIKAMFYYPNEVGRNIEEIKRTLIALQTSEKHEVLTPACWKPGDPVLIPSPESVQAAEKMNEKKNSGLTQVAWYMWYKEIK